MRSTFYISSHDIGSDSRPRKCEVVREISGMRPGSCYLLVNVAPPLRTRFRDSAPTDFGQIIISTLGGRTVRDIGSHAVSAEIVLCPNYADGIVDERQCSRIGTAGLHTTYAEALANSPAEVH